MLNETIRAGLNNPDCAFFVGSWAGQFVAIRYLVIIFLIYFFMKALDKLALDPLIAWIKNKFKQKKR